MTAAAQLESNRLQSQRGRWLSVIADAIEASMPAAKIPC
jgi:hypothetical protein